MIEKNELINTLHSEFIKSYSNFWENSKNVCHKFIKSAILLLEFFDFKNIFVGRCNTWDAYQKKRFFIRIQKIWCFGLGRSGQTVFDTKMPFSNSGISVAISLAQRGRQQFEFTKHKHKIFSHFEFSTNFNESRMWQHKLNIKDASKTEINLKDSETVDLMIADHSRRIQTQRKCQRTFLKKFNNK